MKITGVDASGATTTFRVRRLDPAGVAEVVAAVETARGSSSTGEVYRLPRGFSSAARNVARLVVGLGVVAASLILVTAFLAPDSAGQLLALAFVPVSTVVITTLVVSYWVDAGLAIAPDGRIRREGWGGVTDGDLGRFAEVHVDEGSHHTVVD